MDIEFFCTSFSFLLMISRAHYVSSSPRRMSLSSPQASNVNSNPFITLYIFHLHLQLQSLPPLQRSLDCPSPGQRVPQTLHRSSYRLANLHRPIPRQQTSRYPPLLPLCDHDLVVQYTSNFNRAFREFGIHSPFFLLMLSFSSSYAVRACFVQESQVVYFLLSS